jgi:hypothetical protein
MAGDADLGTVLQKMADWENSAFGGGIVPDFLSYKTFPPPADLPGLKYPYSVHYPGKTIYSPVTISGGTQQEVEEWHGFYTVILVGKSDEAEHLKANEAVLWIERYAAELLKRIQLGGEVKLMILSEADYLEFDFFGVPQHGVKFGLQAKVKKTREVIP